MMVRVDLGDEWFWEFWGFGRGNNVMVFVGNKGHRRHGSTLKPRHKLSMDEDEEGVLYDENKGFDISPGQRRKKKSTFAPQKSKFIQHFPGGYKVESEVPAGTPVPFQAPPLAPQGSPYPMGGWASPFPGVGYPGTPYMGSPYHYPPTHPYYGGYGYGYGTPYGPYHAGAVASKFCCQTLIV